MPARVKVKVVKELSDGFLICQVGKEDDPSAYRISEHRLDNDYLDPIFFQTLARPTDFSAAIGKHLYSPSQYTLKMWKRGIVAPHNLNPEVLAQIFNSLAIKSRDVINTIESNQE